jgi:hypothetical protein
LRGTAGRVGNGVVADDSQDLFDEVVRIGQIGAPRGGDHSQSVVTPLHDATHSRQGGDCGVRRDVQPANARGQVDRDLDHRRGVFCLDCSEAFVGASAVRQEQGGGLF